MKNAAQPSLGRGSTSTSYTFGAFLAGSNNASGTLPRARIHPLSLVIQSRSFHSLSSSNHVRFIRSRPSITFVSFARSSNRVRPRARRQLQLVGVHVPCTVSYRWLREREMAQTSEGAPLALPVTRELTHEIGPADQ